MFQLGSSLLDACVLAALSEGETYGYLLTQSVKDVFGVSESSLYPVLRRLEKEGCLTSSDRPFQGRNRRYYAITPAGGRALAAYRGEWKQYREKVDSILSGGMKDEPAGISDAPAQESEASARG